MKRKKQNKISKVFRLRPDLVEQLKRRSAKTNISQTRLIELALTEAFNRPA